MLIAVWMCGVIVMSKTVLLYEAENFKITNLERKSLDLNLEAKRMESGGVPKYLDKRHLILSTIDASNWDFYLNYLDLCATFARQYPNNKPSYLLELGYIPLIMLPSTNLNLGPKLTALLDAQGVPYVRIPPYSFLTGYTDLDTVDIWVPKMDMAKRFNIKPEDVRSKDLFRRLIIDV